MRDARFQMPSPALLAKVIDKLEMGDGGTKGKRLSILSRSRC
jgi:hypothetical protein